jgi:hypothetical protein
MILAEKLHSAQISQFKNGRTKEFMTEQELIELQKQHEAKIEELQNKIIAMEVQAEEDKISRATREAVKAVDTKPTPAPSVGTQAIRRQQAVAAVGGPAYWSVLPLEKKVAALGLSPATTADVELSRKLFGRNSSSLEASRMARQNPAYYAKLRALHMEL